MKTTIKSIITRVVALALTFITGSALAAAPVGQQITFSNAGLGGGAGAASFNADILSITIPVSDDLPAGTVVRLNSITLGLNSSGDTVYPFMKVGDVFSDQTEKQTSTKFPSNAWKEKYDFTDETLLMVGVKYPINFYQTKDGAAQQSRFYNRNGDAGIAPSVAVIVNSNANNYRPEQEVVVTVAPPNPLVTKMFSSKLATSGEAVPAGTYGGIEVPGLGYSATAYSSVTAITPETGSIEDLLIAPGWNFVGTHTISGWFKIASLPTNGDATIYGFSKAGGTCSYRVAVTPDGYLKVGKGTGQNVDSWDGGNRGGSVTTSVAVPVDEWFYLTIACKRNPEVASADSRAAITVFVNGEQKFTQADCFLCDGGGGSGKKFVIGAGVSAAGLYGDRTAVTDVNTIKNWATNEKLVEAAPEASTATINGESYWSNLNWSVDPVSVDVVRVTVAGDSTLTIDKDVSVADLVFTGSGALTIKGEHTLTATSFDIGSFTLASGALSIPANNTLTSVTVEDGAVLTLDVSSAKTLNGISGAGKLVKTGSAQLNLNNNASGWSVNGTAIQINQGNVQLNSDDRGSTIVDATFVMNGGSLNCYSWATANGTLTVENDSNVTILNKSLNGMVDFVKKGSGILTLGFGKGNSGTDGFSSVTVEGGALTFSNLNLLNSDTTFDFSALNKTATPIAGNFTFSDGYTFKFPNGWAAGEVFQLCSGTLSGIPDGGKLEDFVFNVGEESKTADFHLSSNGSIFYNYGVKELAPAGDYAISTLNDEKVEEGQTVELTMAAGATLTIDATAQVATTVFCEGNLIIVGANGAEPSAEQLAALNFEGVTGTIVKKWLATMGVININLNVDNGKFPEGDTSDDGMLAGNTPKSSWINTTGATGTLTDITEWKTLTQESAAVSGMTFTWDANLVYHANATIPIRGGYLDDGKDNGVTLTMTGVPYPMYDVIVYFSTDQGGGSYQPMTVNGIAYTGDKTTKTTAIGNATWGDNAVVASVEEGVNALRVHDLAGDVTIHTAKRNGSTRGCVAAIQIVEVPAKEYRREYTAVENVDVKTSDLNAYVAEGDSYTGPFTLTLNGGKLIYDADFVCSALVVDTTDAKAIVVDYELDSADEFRKVAFVGAGAPLEITTTLGLPVNFGANALTYNYNGTSEATPTFTGTGAFTKGGTGTILLTNTFNPGSITVAGGVLKRPNGTGWAFNNKSITVLAGGQFYENGGYDKGGITYTIAGAGPDGASAAIVESESNCGAGNAHCGGITLSADATFKTEDDFFMVGSGYAANTLALGDYTLTKIGGGSFNLCSTTITGAGTIKVMEGTLGFCNNKTCSMPDGTILLDGGDFDVSQAFTLNNLTIRNGAVTGNGALSLSGSITIAGNIAANDKLASLSGSLVITDGAVYDLTEVALPIANVIGTTQNGTIKITKPVKSAKIAPIADSVTGLVVVDENGATIADVCEYDGFLWYGKIGTGTYTITTEDEKALEAMVGGEIYSPATLEVNISAISGTPEDFFGWIENGAVYFAKKSNSISLKTGTRTADRDSAIGVTDEAVGGFPVAGKFWNVAKVSNGNAGNPVSEYLTLSDGNGEATSVSVAYYAVNTYFAKQSPGTPTNGNQRLTATYLDDGDIAPTTQWTVDKGDETSITLPKTPNNRGWQVQVSNIPYEMYDLYVYIASDQVDNKDNANNHLYACPVVISCDGVDWTYYAGPAKAEDSSRWEAYGWAHDGEVVEGKNYIRFRISKNSTGLDDISTIHITHGTRDTNANKRLGLAGIQIVEIDDDGVRDRVVVGDGAQNWHDAAAWKKTNKEGVASNVDWVDATENPITARVNAEEVPALVMDSDALATKLEVTGGTVEAPVEFTLSGSGTLTTETIDATKLHGTLNFEAPVKGTISLATDSYLVVPVSGTIDSLDAIMPEGLSITSGKLKLRGDAAFTALTNDFSQIPVSVIDITETSCNVPMIIGANQTVIVDGSKWTSEAIFAAATSRITFKGNYSAVPGIFSGAQGIINFAGTFASATDLTDSGLNYYLEFSGALTAPNVNFTNFKQFTTLQGCDINVETNMTIYGADGSRQIYLTYGQVTVGETLRVYGGNGQYGRFHFGNDSDDPESCVITAKTVNSASQGTVIDAYQLNAGLTVNLGVGGWSLSGHGSYPDYAKMELHGTKIVATGDTFLNPNKFNVTADSTLEVPAETTLTLRKVLAGNAKVIKTGEGTLVLAAGESSAVQVNAGTLKMAAGNEANVTVGENGGLTLTVTEEQWINGYTSTAVVPDGKDITFLDPAGNVIEGTTGKVLPIKPGVKTWTGATDNNWNVGTNWDPVGVPDTDGIVKINATNDVDVAITLNDAVTIVTLMIDGANSVTLSGAALSITEDIKKNGAGKLTIEDLATVGAYAWNAGDLELGGAFAVPAVAIPADGTLTLVVDEAKSVTSVISGAGKLVKAGEGTLTLSVQNTFSGGLKIVGGVVKMGNYLALGPSGSVVEIARGATLDMADTNGVDGYYTAKFVNEGEGEVGRLIKSTTTHLGVGKTYPIRHIVLDEGADAEIYVEADANCGLVGQGWGSSSITLNGNTLTKTGAGLFYFANTTVNGQGVISLEAGTISVEHGALTANDATLKVGTDATLNVADATTVKNLEMNGTRTGASALVVNGVLSGTGNVGDIVLGEDSSLDATKGPIMVTSLYSNADKLIIKCPPTGGKLIKGLALDPSANVVLIDAKTGEEIPRHKVTLSFKNGTLAFSLNGFMLMLK